MTKGKHGGTGEFAALREFARGYLHQDFEDEYGSAAGAARAFCEDANEMEKARVAQQWKTFVDGLAGLSADEVNRKLGEIGAAWNVTAISDLNPVTAVFGEA
jgi:hypothetical protein